MNRYSYFSLMAAAALALASISGCSEKRVAVFPVTGKLTFEGQAPEGAQVVLHPVSSTEANNVTAAGSVKSDGTFKITVYEDGDGAPAGDYVATVQWFRFVADEGSGGRGPNVLPAKYASAETSPIKVTVKSGTNELPPIDLTN